MDKLYSISKAAEILGVSDETLRNWHKEGTLVPVKTQGGHRRYRESDINNRLGINIVPEEVEKESANKVAIYGRVSSHDQKQKGDLDRQCQRLSEYCAKKKYKVEYIIKDVGSGLSDTRVGLNRLFDLVIDKTIRKVVIENKDRLTRFQYNVLVKFFDSYNVAVECIEINPDATDEQDLVNDLMMLMASFSGKLYGRRSAKRRKENKEKTK